MNCINHNRIRMMSSVVILAVIQAGVIACGGGGGGSNTGTNPIQTGKNVIISGQLNNSVTRAAAVHTTATRSTLIPNATINAYLWPDLKTVITHTQSNGQGEYTITLPPVDAGLNVVLEAVVGTARYSTLVAGITSVAITNADIDPSTSLAAELVSNAATGPPLINIISGSAISTIATEFKSYCENTSVDLSVGGQNLQTNFGSGLNTSTTGTTESAYTFEHNDPIIQAALKDLNNSTNLGVAGAKQVVQMVRGLLSGLLDDGTGEQSAITTAANKQVSTVNSTLQGISAFTQRLEAFKVTGVDGGSFNSGSGFVSSNGWQTLQGLPSGKYSLVPNPIQFSYPPYILNQTGASPDGKSWVVTFAQGAGIPANGLVLTITPANAIPTLDVTVLTAGSFAIKVLDPGDASVNYNGTLVPTVNTSTNTTVTLNASLSDSALTQPIVVSGTFVGTPASGAGGNTVLGPFTNMTLNASLTSQYGNASVTNLAAQYYTNSYVGNIKSVTLGSLTSSDTLNPSGQVTITGVTANFATPIAADGTHKVISSASFTGADLKASGYELNLTNGTVTFVRSDIDPTHSEPSTIQATAAYTSPQLSIQGAITGTWTNAQANNLTLRNPGTNTTTLTNFPQGTLNLKGTVTPVTTGNPYSADLTLMGTVNGTNGVATLTINSITAGYESLTGSAIASYPSTNGIVSNQATWNVKLTQTPNNDVVALQGVGSNMSGTIKSSTGAVEANIGAANQAPINLVELGSATIILYADGTFETAASILP